jgi:Leucine-rich repeat (LRR) protein
LITGTGKTLTARVIDTAGNVTALPLSNNGYTLDTSAPLLTVCTTLFVEKNLISEIVKESGGTIIFETLDIQSANITIGGTDVRLSLLLLPLSSSLAKSKLIGAVGLEVSMVTVAGYLMAPLHWAQ